MAESGSLTVNVGTYDSDYSLHSAPTGDVSGKNADNTSSYVEAIGSKGETNWIYWPFDVSQIPAGAQINAVSCRFRAWVSFVTYITPSASLCSGTTTKTGSVSFSDTTAKVYTVSGGTWTRDEIAKCRLKLTATFSSSSGASIGRRYFYLGGADLTVTYTYQSEKFMLKLGGAYNDVARTFKKVSGIWVEQEELANVIEDGVRYKNGGEIVIPKPTFTIQGVAYQFEDGMTWAEWVASSYNTGGFVASGTSIKAPSGLYVYNSASGSNVKTTDSITSGSAYGVG